MKPIYFVSFLASFILSSYNIGAQQYNYVGVKSGLRVRNSFELSSEKIGLLQFAERVKILEEKEDIDTIESVIGKWTKIDFKGAEGWVFGGFLVEYNPTNGLMELALRSEDTRLYFKNVESKVGNDEIYDFQFLFDFGKFKVFRFSSHNDIEYKFWYLGLYDFKSDKIVDAIELGDDVYEAQGNETKTYDYTARKVNDQITLYRDQFDLVVNNDNVYVPRILMSHEIGKLRIEGNSFVKMD